MCVDSRYNKKCYDGGQSTVHGPNLAHWGLMSCPQSKLYSAPTTYILCKNVNFYFCYFKGGLKAQTYCGFRPLLTLYRSSEGWQFEQKIELWSNSSTGQSNNYAQNYLSRVYQEVRYW